MELETLANMKLPNFDITSQQLLNYQQQNHHARHELELRADAFKSLVFIIGVESFPHRHASPDCTMEKESVPSQLYKLTVHMRDHITLAERYCTICNECQNVDC